MGDGKLPVNEHEEIEIPDNVQFDRSGDKISTETDLIEDVFGDSLRQNDYETILNRAIFAAKNTTVNEYNKRIVDE